MSTVQEVMHHEPDAPIVQTNDVVSFDQMEDGPPQATRQEIESDASLPTGQENAVREEQKGEEDGKEEKEEEKVEKSPKQKEVDKAVQKVKKLELISGDEKQSVPFDSLVNVKVDGKTEQVKIQDLLNNYSGKTNWDRKYTQLDLEKKKFESERADLQNAVNEIHRLAVSEKNLPAAMEFIAEAMGGDPHELMREAKSRMLKELEELSGLSDEERQIQELQAKIKHQEAKEKRLRAQQDEARDAQEIEKRLQEVQKSHGMSDEEIVAAFDALKASGKEIDEITPELVGEKHVELTQQAKTEAITEELLSDSEVKTEASVELLKIMQNHPELDENDLKDIVREVWLPKKQEESVKRLSRKVNKNMEKNAEAGVKNADQSPLFFDDI